MFLLVEGEVRLAKELERDCVGGCCVTSFLFPCFFDCSQKRVCGAVKALFG